MESGISAEDLELARSFSLAGAQQVVWTYDVRVVTASLYGMARCSAKYVGHIFAQKLAMFLLEAEIDIRIIKDLVSLAVIASEGGLYLDLDYAFVGRCIPLVHGYVFGTEPYKKWPAQPYIYAYTYTHTYTRTYT